MSTPGLDERCDQLLLHAVTGPAVVIPGILFENNVRAPLVNPESQIGPLRGVADPILHDHDTPQLLYDALIYSGNIVDGAAAAAFAHLALSVAAPRALSERLRSKLSVAIGVGIVTIHELGMLSGAAPDIKDIPSGVIGAGLFALIHSKISKYNFWRINTASSVQL